MWAAPTQCSRRALRDEIGGPACPPRGNGWFLRHQWAQFEPADIAWGVLGWPPDLRAWRQTVAARLRSGGRCFIAGLHSVAWLLDAGNILGSADDRQTWDCFDRGRR